MDIDLIHRELEKKDWKIEELGEFDYALIADVAEVVEKQLTIQRVSQQRELLKAYDDKMSSKHMFFMPTPKESKDEFLEAFNCG